MAKRPVFIPKVEGLRLVEEVYVDFKWHPGLALSQKRKNIEEIHAEAKRIGIHPILEVSSRADNDFGVSLSAFNLKFMHHQLGLISVESAFQGSKVFESGGPYTDLYKMSGMSIKKDLRLKNSGRLKYFYLDNIEWSLKPKTAFYDWLYINALTRKEDIASKLLTYHGFTDVQFNPKKSINCQARSCALYVSLVKRGKLADALKDRSSFLNILSKASFDDFDLYDQ